MENWSDFTVSPAFGKQHANLAHFSCGEFGHAMSLAVRVALLDDHIGGIVSTRSKEKMDRLDADWSITGMEDARASGDRAIGQLPCKAVGAPPLQVSIGEYAISVAIRGSHPKPAIAGLVGESVEADILGNSPVAVGARARTEILSRLAESRAADGTGFLNRVWRHDGVRQL